MWLKLYLQYKNALDTCVSWWIGCKSFLAVFPTLPPTVSRFLPQAAPTRYIGGENGAVEDFVAFAAACTLLCAQAKPGEQQALRQNCVSNVLCMQ